MKILWLFLLFAFESLFVNYASSRCQSLNGTLFNSCFNAGYNVSEFNYGKAQQDIFSLFERVQRKFNHCSSLSTVLSCALHVPKCPNATLPCKAECRKFVRDCKDIPAESQGLRALFQGLCELLEPKHCLSMSNASSFNGSDDDVTCSPLRISHCANAGYNFTRVSRAYQAMVESSKIFQGVNSTLKKVICMELAPPCETNKSRTVYVPCRSTCEAAYNESNSKFLDFFKSSDYCSTFPYEKPQSGKAYCAFRTWPNTGYWPSYLWERISLTGLDTAGQLGSSAPPTTPASSKNDSSISPGSNLTTSQPTASTRGTSTTRASTANSPLKSSGTSTFPASSTNSSGPSTTPAPSTNSSGPSTTPSPSTNSSGTSTVPAPSTNSSGPSTTPAPSTNSSGPSTTPAPSTNSSGPSTTPAPSTNSSGPSTTPAPSTNSSGPSTTPAPSTNSSGPSTTPAPSTNSSGPSTTPSPSTNSSGPSTTPAPSTNSSGPSTTPSPSTNSSGPSTTPAPSTNSSGPSTTPSPSTNSSGPSTTPSPSTKPSGQSTTPASSTEPSGTSTTPATSTEPSGTSTTPASPSNSSAVNTTSVTTTNSSGTSGKPVRTTQPAGVRTNGTAVSETRPAITTTENKGPPEIKATLKKKLSPGAICGIVVGLLIVLAAIVVGGVCFRRYNKRRAQYRHSLMVDMDEL